MHRRPTEAIAEQQRRADALEERVRAALRDLAATGKPFTVEDVCKYAGVGKTFIYNPNRPSLKRDVIAARDRSHAQRIPGMSWYRPAADSARP